MKLRKHDDVQKTQRLQQYNKNVHTQISYYQTLPSHFFYYLIFFFSKLYVYSNITSKDQSVKKNIFSLN